MKKAFRRFLLAVPVSLVLFTIVYFAGLRSWHLGWGATEAELAAVMPGDELLPIGNGQATHAITIHAVPEDRLAMDHADRAGSQRVLQLYLVGKLNRM